MLIGSIFQQLYNIADSIVVGNYIGKEALSAVGASFPIFYTLISMIMGISSGAATIVSQYFGAKKIDMVQKATDTLFITLLMASILVMSAGLFFMDNIFALIKLPPDVIPDAKIYLSITLIGVIPAFGYNTTAALLRSIGDSKTPLYFLIISTVTNIILDLIFVPILKMGVEGVAIATVLSQTGAFITGIIYINKKIKIVNLRFLKMRFHKSIFLKSLKIGLPTGMQQMFVALGITAIFSIVNTFGTVIIAAYSVATRIGSIAIMPAMNLGQALSSFTGQNIGAGKIFRVKKGLWATIKITSLLSLTISLIVIFGSRYFMSFFTSDDEIINAGMHYLKIEGSSYIIFGLMFTFIGVFRGAGDTIIPMFISLFSLWIFRLPLSYYLSGIYGETGIWYSIPLAWFAGCLFAFLYYLSGKWKQKAIM